MSIRRDDIIVINHRGCQKPAKALENHPPKGGEKSLFVAVEFFDGNIDGIYIGDIIDNFGLISKEEFIEQYPEKIL